MDRLSTSIVPPHRTLIRGPCHTIRLRRWFVWGLLPAAALGGCADVDWNWDLGWWKRPHRVVRPTRPAPAAADHNEVESASSARDRQDTETDLDQRHDAPERSADAADPQREATLDDRQATTPRFSPVDKPFYHLYLTNKPVDESEERGEFLLMLKNAVPRGCARILEMLYPPMGRSGSADDSYLIYENPDEFAAAARFVPTLDVSTLDQTQGTVGPDEAFRAGIGLAYTVLDAGAVAPREQVDACMRKLSEAAQSSSLPAQRRWAAAVVAGRLASDYSYDYPSARSFYLQAERASQDGSLEQMIARWWKADSLVQEGKRAEAAMIFKAIVDEWRHKWEGSYVVRRSLAALEQPVDE